MTKISIRVITDCWLVFIGYWIISARGVKPVAERPDRVSSMAYLAYRVLLILGSLLLWWRPLAYPLNWDLTPRTDLAHGIGAIVCAFGLFIAIWARNTLAGNWSSAVTFKQGHELIQTGPYRFVRHPIYTGLLLMCLGTAIVRGHLSSWVGFLMQCTGFWIKLHQEESLMLRHFPGEYAAYRSRVKALFPFII